MYKILQKEVFDWLIEKNKNNANFTFSVRQKANKGAELNYFIGTENSQYFSTTFWFIPVSFPGSSSDLINLVFDLKKDKIEFHIRFNQTKNPSDDQNKCNLILVQNIKNRLNDSFENTYSSAEDAKMEFFGIYSTPKYMKFGDLKYDLEKLLDNVIPIVDEEIAKIKNENPAFIAHRFSQKEQRNMLQKMEERFDKYKIIDELTDDLEEEDVELFNFKFTALPLNQILYGPPGTGKTYNTINKAIAIVHPSFDLKQERSIVKAEYLRLVEEGQIVFTTFHQSMSYEDFVEGIKPLIEEDGDGNKQLIYEVKDGIFKEIVQAARKIKIVNNESKGIHYFDDAWNELINKVKEEISKNKLLKIGSWDYGLSTKDSLKYSSLNSPSQYTFTITKQNIQDVYHGKQARPSGAFQKDMEDIVHYMKKYFNLNDFKEVTKEDSNDVDKRNYVLIIDEINRGNVSAIFGELITLIEDSKREGKEEALEVILPYSKEKFSVPSNLHIIGTMNTADRSVESLDTALRRRFVFEEMLPNVDLKELDYDVYGHTASAILERINLRIEKLIDRDHCIGHAYFIGKDEESLLDSFYKNIIPLLQEYFFGDYGKIGLVLGSGFIQRLDAADDIFASFDYDYKEDLASRIIYQIIDYRKFDDKETGFKSALDILMK